MVPDDLSESGRRAFVMASKHVDAMPDPERFADAVLRFARAIDLVEEVRAEWNAAGRPKLFTHSNGSIVPHPLVKLLAESEKDAARAGRALKLEPEAIKGQRGGSLMGRQTSPDRKIPPVVKLSSKRLSA